jgi:hypothetical protein
VSHLGKVSEGIVLKFTHRQFHSYCCYVGQVKGFYQQYKTKKRLITETFSSYTYQDLITENLFNIFSFVYSSQPIRLRVSFSHVSKTRPIRSYFMCNTMSFIYWIEKSRCVYNKQKTAWKVLCTVSIRSLWSQTLSHNSYSTAIDHEGSLGTYWPVNTSRVDLVYLSKASIKQMSSSCYKTSFNLSLKSKLNQCRTIIVVLFDCGIRN